MPNTQSTNRQNPYVLVCVTNQSSCERLIRAGVSLAEAAGLPIRVLSVFPEKLVSEPVAAAMQQLYDTAGAYGAPMTVLFNRDPALTVAVHARKTGAAHIITGTPDAYSNLFFETVKGLLPELPMSIVDADNRLYTFPPYRVPAPVSMQSHS